jgi:prepilin-type N-terminal cleavage/methylation domain-containing protein/prepilin-type processing-associated H-X9-DG protein
MRHSNTNRWQGGFTLIELLVVIAIIAILAAILFPVFATAREKARATACVSNEKQIGISIMQYAQDFDEMFPCGMAQTSSSSGGGYGWAGQIYPYLKSVDVFHCPSDPTKPYNSTYTYTSYGYNSNLDSATGNKPFTCSLNKLSSPANIVCMYEVVGANGVALSGGGISPTEAFDPTQMGWPGYFPGGCWSSEGCAYATGNMGVPFTSATYFTAGRHNNGSNFIAADGHVKWLTGEKISNGVNPAGASSPASTGSYISAGSDNMTNGGSIRYTLTFSVL